jgi:DNA-directed RNA polymerase specialized sigma24 family protein
MVGPAGIEWIESTQANSPSTEHSMNLGIISAAACAALVAGQAGLADIDADTITSIERYCTTSWRQAAVAAQDWDDCTQQVFLDLLNRITRDRLAEAIQEAKSHERRELNRAIWATVQRWRRTRRHYSLGEDEPPDTRQIRAQLTLAARESIAEAARGLTARQRMIVSGLLDGSTIAEIGQSLDIPVRQISDDRYKAIRKLRGKLRTPKPNVVAALTAEETGRLA